MLQRRSLVELQTDPVQTAPASSSTSHPSLVRAAARRCCAGRPTPPRRGCRGVSKCGAAEAMVTASRHGELGWKSSFNSPHVNRDPCRVTASNPRRSP